MTHHSPRGRAAFETLAAGLDNAVPPTMPDRPEPNPHDPAAVTDVHGTPKTGAQLLSAGLESEIRKVQK